MEKFKCNFCKKTWQVEKSSEYKVQICPFCKKEQKNTWKNLELGQAIYLCMKKHGINFINDKDAFTRELKQLLPGKEKEINILIRSGEEEDFTAIQNIMTKYASDTEIQEKIREIKNRIVENTGLSTKWGDLFESSFVSALKDNRDLNREPSREDIIEWWKHRGENNDAHICYMLGYAYEFGDGVERSYREAVKWYEKAACLNDVDAYVPLGDCYYCGIGVEQSYREAVKWYEKAAEENEYMACGMLGDCYYEGKGVKQSYTEAVKWYKREVENGNMAYADILGDCYYKGIGVERSYQDAFKYYQSGAEIEIEHAIYMMGQCYFYGHGVKRSYEEAVNCFRSLAEYDCVGSKDSCKRLGDCYFGGYGVEISHSEAQKWWDKAKKQ